jgi:hypothetical protein
VLIVTLFFGVMTLATARVGIPGYWRSGSSQAWASGRLFQTSRRSSASSARANGDCLLTWIGTGYTAGAAIGGFLAAWMIPEFGWPSVFLPGWRHPAGPRCAHVYLAPGVAQAAGAS